MKVEFSIGILTLVKGSLLNQIHTGVDHIIAGLIEEALTISRIARKIQINGQKIRSTKTHMHL